MPEPVTLIAGFPSVIARSLLTRVLAAGTERVLLLVSSEQEASVKAHLGGLLDVWARRVTVHEGNVAAIDLGLGGAEYRRLAREITTIHFIAPLTSPNAGQKRAEYLNVGGARELIELGRNCTRLERILYYSSATVSGDRSGSILENDLENHQRFRSAVEHSLAVAERMLRARFTDLPISVLRPSLICCDSKTGEMDRDNPLGLLLFLLLSSPPELPVFIPGDGSVPLNLSAADFVADVALRLAALPQMVGKTFHVTDPDPPSVRRFFELVAQHAGRKPPSGSLPPGLSKALVNAPGPLSWAKTPRVLVDLMTTRARYDHENMERALQGSGLSHPPFESYVELLVNAAKQRRAASKRSSSEPT